MAFNVRMAGVRSIHTVFSTQNVEQRALSSRFEALALASQGTATPVPVRGTELTNLERDDGTVDTFRTAQWYRVLVRKVNHWAALADAHPGELLLCSDNDISLLPGWREALLDSYDAAGRPDLCFQREGGDDPFFAAFPYNSGFFLMNGSTRVARFWRHVAARTEREQPFTGDQAVVNSLLVARQTDGEPGCTANPLELRHAHFDTRLVHGGPSVPDAAALRAVRVHHATGSGSARGSSVEMRVWSAAQLGARASAGRGWWRRAALPALKESPRHAEASRRPWGCRWLGRRPARRSACGPPGEASCAYAQHGQRAVLGAG